MSFENFETEDEIPVSETGPKVWLKLWGRFEDDRRTVMNIFKQFGLQAAKRTLNKTTQEIGEPEMWSRVFIEGAYRDPRNSDLVEETRESLIKLYCCLDGFKDESDVPESNEDDGEILYLSLDEIEEDTDEDTIIEILSKLKHMLVKSLRALRHYMKSKNPRLPAELQFMEEIGEYEAVSFHIKAAATGEALELMEDIAVLLEEVQHVRRGGGNS